ncbi:MAG TPA: hypothetical protein DDX92_12445 [Flavobacteriales bacterium]|nr:hypothetical protein [Flavobacteriales bacterium]
MIYLNTKVNIAQSQKVLNFSRMIIKIRPQPMNMGTQDKMTVPNEPNPKRRTLFCFLINFFFLNAH